MKNILLKSFLALSILSFNAQASTTVAENVLEKIIELSEQGLIASDDYKFTPPILTEEINRHLSPEDKRYLYEMVNGRTEGDALTKSEMRLRKFYEESPALRIWFESLNPFGNGQIGSMPSTQTNPFA